MPTKNSTRPPNCTCEACGNPFYAKPNRIKLGSVRFCSVECRRNHGNYGERQQRVCLQCGKEFTAWASTVRYGNGKYCSHPCWAKRSIPSASVRFWERVEQSSCGCWQWQGPIGTGGYGAFSPARGQNTAAHRFAYADTYGPIPDGLSACHRCDNRLCVRPDHLFLGTALDNNRDCIAKGRKSIQRGSQSSQAKITEDDVRAIRSAYAAGGIGQPDLARRYGITATAIWAVIHRRTWAHVE